MLGSQTVTEALEAIELSLRRIKEHLAEHAPHTMQLTPTGSYWLGVGNTHIGTVVSLAQVKQSPWQKNREHWFRASGIDWAQQFETKNDFSIVPQIDCGTSSPCAPLQAQMDVLGQSWTANFQMYALGLLQPQDWTSNPPTLGTRLFYFSAPGTSPTRPRIVFDVNAQDPTKLDHIVWLTDDNSLSAYPVQPITLHYVDTSMPSASYYYTASS